jgi:hypothetical protein
MAYVGDDFELDMNGGAGGHRRKGMKGMILDVDGNVIAHVFGHAEVVDTAKYKFVKAMAPGGKDVIVPTTPSAEVSGESLF